MQPPARFAMRLLRSFTAQDGALGSAARRPLRAVIAEPGNWSLTGVWSRGAEEDVMGGILTLVVIVYLVGIGVVLAPTVQGEWNTGTASAFFGSILQELPVAAAWPVTLYHRMMDRSAG
jgi:hypothetical protein